MCEYVCVCACVNIYRCVFIHIYIYTYVILCICTSKSKSTGMKKCCGQRFAPGVLLCLLLCLSQGHSVETDDFSDFRCTKVRKRTCEGTALDPLLVKGVLDNPHIQAWPVCMLIHAYVHLQDSARNCNMQVDISIHFCIYICIYIYIYMCICTHISMYIYIHVSTQTIHTCNTCQLLQGRTSSSCKKVAKTREPRQFPEIGL